MFDLFVNDKETNYLFEYHLINMQLFFLKYFCLHVVSIVQGGRVPPSVYVILRLSVVKKNNIFFLVYICLMYMIEWNIVFEFLIAIYLHIFKHVI